MPLRILTVCTANVCRSPMAAALLSHRLREWGLEADVRSAGTHAGIADFDPAALAVMTERNLDISAHRPRLAARDVVTGDGADLVVTMTRAHLRDIASMGPDVFRRGFTIKELARRCGSLPKRPAPGEASIGGWCAALGACRKARDLLGDSAFDDVADPYGMSVELHRRTADELDALVTTVAMSLAGWLGATNQG